MCAFLLSVRRTNPGEHREGQTAQAERKRGNGLAVKRPCMLLGHRAHPPPPFPSPPPLVSLHCFPQLLGARAAYRHKERGFLSGRGLPGQGQKKHCSPVSTPEASVVSVRRAASCLSHPSRSREASGSSKQGEPVLEGAVKAADTQVRPHTFPKTRPPF